MALTYEKYQKLQALLKDPNKDFSDEARARAQSAVDAYKNDFMARGKYADEPPLAEGENDRILAVSNPTGPSEHPDAARVQGLIAQLDPTFSLPAQALALQPATTHPQGDEAAKDEWIRGDLNNPNGLVVAYDLPVSEVRKKLLEQPQLFKALQLSIPADPEAVMAIEEGDSTHQAFNDYMFREAAEKATAAGKTIYRYSKAPWLSEGNGAGFLQTLKTKWDTMPADAPQAFVLGYDDTANFGAGRAAQESGSSFLQSALGGFSDEDAAKLGMKRPEPSFEKVGGMPEGQSAQERNDALVESNPTAHTLGQSLSMLAPWTAANRLWGWVVGEGAEAGAKTALRGVASGAGRGAAAGAADQTVREGAQAASSYAATGDSGTTLAESGERIAAAAGGAALPASLLRGAGGLARQVTEEVKWGDAYKGAPGRVEALGVEPKIGRGHVAPEVVQNAERRGRVEGGKSALTVLAEDLDEPLADAANYRQADVERIGKGNAAEHYATREGKATLPMRNLAEAAAERLRGLTSEVPKGRLKGVAKPHAESPVRDIFNQNIEGISDRATKNGVELSVQEARAFLEGRWLWKLVPKKDAARAASNTEAQVILKKRLDQLEKKGAKIYVTPRRYDSQHADEVIEQLGKSTDDNVAAVYEAALKDREGRSWSGVKGGWARVQDEQERAQAHADDVQKKLGSTKPGGVRRAVMKVGKSRGQSDLVPALEETARRAGGGVVSEKLRGARVAEDLADLKSWSSVGGKSPRGDGRRSLLGLTAFGDMAMLKGIYPAARKVEKARSPAAATGRAGAAVGRSLADDRDDDRRRERDEKSAEGYRERAKEAGSGERKSRKRKLVRRRRSETSEAER